MVGAYEVQGRGGSIKMQVDLGSDLNFNIKSITKLGTHNITAWFPATSDTSYGVISPVDKSVNLESI